jgi:trans-2,3-dihydro-3-hydroxyanthranilate isomerase
MSRGCIVVRVFTRGDTGGNHLGVVNDIVGLDGARMQSIASELGFSESVFVEWPAGGIPNVRIFTPGDELPFAGHPLVGTAWVLNTLGPGRVAALRCEVGEMTVRSDGTATWIETPQLGEVADPQDAVAWVARAGLEGVADVSRVMMPLEYVLAELPRPSQVAAANVDMDVVVERFGLLAWAREGEAVKVRFFAPGTAVDEDPATGSAAVAWARLMVARGEVAGAVTISQGDEIGHPSTIELTWGDGAVAIGGSVVHDETRMLDI